MPSSSSVKLCPADEVPVTGPTPAPQLMLRADTVLATPTVNAAGVLTTENKARLAQFTALKALSLRPEMVVLVIDGLGSPPERMRFLIERQSRVGFWALSRAARPATCGADIEVPLAWV